MDNIDLLHYNRSEKYVRAIKKQYKALIDEISRLTVSYGVDVSKPFDFSDYPQLHKEVDKLLKNFAGNMVHTIDIGIQNEWYLGIKKVSEYLPFNLKRSSENRAKNKSFISERVWKYMEQYKGELEMALDLGIGKGRSANILAREIKQYLNEPDKLFRRVRDKHGNLHLSKKAKKYHSGQGVYRSSFKNAQRLARTETNRAYHEAIWHKYNELDFVVGYEVKLSNNPKHCPFCSAMAGKYPKDFKFKGWHPNCRCSTIPILAKDINDVKEEEKIKEIPDNLKSWLEENKEKIDHAKSKPWFITENNLYLKESKIRSEVLTLMDVAKKSKKSVFELADSIAKQLDGKLAPINLKTEKSILRKVKTELNGDVSQIKDAIRTTIVLREDVFKKILKNSSFFSIFERVKIQSSEQFAGYSGILTNIKTKRGIWAEIQFNTDKMIYAKEKPSDAIRIIGKKRWKEINKEIGLEGGLGHYFYEEMRMLPKNDIRRIELEKKSIEYYSKFR